MNTIKISIYIFLVAFGVSFTGNAVEERLRQLLEPLNNLNLKEGELLMRQRDVLASEIITCSERMNIINQENKNLRTHLFISSLFTATLAVVIEDWAFRKFVRPFAKKRYAEKLEWSTKNNLRLRLISSEKRFNQFLNVFRGVLGALSFVSTSLIFVKIAKSSVEGN